MKRLSSLFVVLALLPMARGAEEKQEENPYKKAKVGDWIEYKTITNFAGAKIEGTMKQTVAEKNDKEATLKTTINFQGMEIAGPEAKIDLTKPFDPLSASLPQGSEIKVEKLGDGKEKLKVGGKEYDCEWVKLKMKGKAMGMDFDGDAKVWTAKSVPLGGVVKMDMTTKILDTNVVMTMEYAGSGSK